MNTEDGRTLHKIAQIQNNDATLIPFKLEIEEITTQHLEIHIKNYGIIPDGFQGAGNKAWTFLDEIIVK